MGRAFWLCGRLLVRVEQSPLPQRDVRLRLAVEEFVGLPLHLGGGVAMTCHGVEQLRGDRGDPQQLVGGGLPVTEILLADGVKQVATALMS